MAAATCMIPPAILGRVFGRVSFDPAVTAKIGPKLPPCQGADKLGPQADNINLNARLE
jgi:hypothetical protein